MLEVVGQDIISGNMGFIGTDPGREYQMGAAEKTEDITVTGNPAVLDNATGKPFKDLHIYGRSEQMTTTGAQLLDTSKLRKNNCTMKIEEQGRKITITGRDAYSGARIATADIGMFSDGIGKQIFISEKATVLSGNAIVAVALSYVLDGVASYIAMGGGGFTTKIIPDGATLGTLQINVNHSNEALDEDTTVVFEDLIVGIGSAALPFEPYTGGKPSPSPDYPQEIVSAGDDGNLSVIVKKPDNEQMQSVSFSTPNGLPGILVSAGGNYTDETGQQWICDEVDLGRGMYVQRVKAKELSADDKWAYQKLNSGNNNFQTRVYGGDSAKNSFPAICNILPYKNPIWNDDSKNLPKIYANNSEITISFPPSSEYSSLETFKQLLKNAKSFIFYCLATPIETPLTAAEIAAYKSLRTYRGTTIVEAEDKAGISVTFKRNVKTGNVSAEKKIEESEKKEYDES